MLNKAQPATTFMVTSDWETREIRVELRRNPAKLTGADLERQMQLQYDNLGKHFALHDKVNHGIEEYARGDVSTNTVEGYFSIFKRGMKGVYQHCGKKHLHRYAAEFAFRYSNRVANGVDDRMRFDLTLMGVSGKRLSYARSD